MLVAELEEKTVPQQMALACGARVFGMRREREDRTNPRKRRVALHALRLLHAFAHVAWLL